MRRNYDALPMISPMPSASRSWCCSRFQFHAAPPGRLPGARGSAFAGLVGVSTVGGFLVYIFGLGRLSAGVVTIVAMSEIVFSAILANIFLDETLTLAEIREVW